MKKRIFILSIFVALFTSGLIAQTLRVDLPPGYYKIQETVKKGDQGIDGSPYLNDDWMPGVLEKLDGTVIHGLEYRYNVAGKQIQFRKDGQLFSIGSPFKIKTVEFGGRIFIYSKYKENGRQLYDYFEKVTDGDFQLLCRFEMELKPANFSYTHNVGNQNDTYIIHEAYYLMKPEGDVVKIDMRKRSVLNTLSDKKDEIEMYLKETKIRLKRESDLIKVINYYNTIQSS